MKKQSTKPKHPPQINFRIPLDLRESVNAEIRRMGRRRDIVAERVWKHFLSLKPADREQICTSKAA